LDYLCVQLENEAIAEGLYSISIFQSLESFISDPFSSV
jgi:hypothetical protein